jgi:hypothetical protein
MSLEFHDDVDPSNREQTIVLHFTVPEQRKMVEAEAGEPCFRMWVSRQEFERGSFADWTHYELSDGRIAIWRRESDLDKLQAGGEINMWRAITERRITDDVI